MNPEAENPNPAEVFASSEVERMLASVGQEESASAPAPAAPAVEAPLPGEAQPYDFRNPMVLSPTEMRKLRLHQEEFIKGLASRLSRYLRLEFSLKLTGVRTITSRKFAESWDNPSHLTLFKLEPLRGVSILEIAPRFGLAMVDRLMGGPGQPPEIVGEPSEIEKALLEQTVQLVLAEWCAHWPKLKELKPVLLGYESNGRFIQTAPPETTMLVVAMEGGLGDCTGKIQIGLPFVSVEAMVRQLSQGADSAPQKAPAPVAPAASQWNAGFDDVRVPVSAEWDGPEVTAREILNLKVGDVLKLTPECAGQVKVRLADRVKFSGRPGALAGQWAVELTQVLKR